MRPGAGHHGHGGPQRVQVVLLEVLAEKLIGDGYFDAILADVQDAQRADPGVQHLLGEPTVQGAEKLVMQVVMHGDLPLRSQVTHTLIHGGG